MSGKRKSNAASKIRVGAWFSRLERRAKEFEKRSGRLDRLLKQTIQELADEKKAVTQDMREALLQTLLTIKIEMDLLIARDAFRDSETKEKLSELSTRLRDAILGARLFSRLFYTPRHSDSPPFRKGKKRLFAEPPQSRTKPPVPSPEPQVQQRVPFFRTASRYLTASSDSSLKAIHEKGPIRRKSPQGKLTKTSAHDE